MHDRLEQNGYCGGIFILLAFPALDLAYPLLGEGERRALAELRRRDEIEFEERWEGRPVDRYFEDLLREEIREHHPSGKLGRDRVREIFAYHEAGLKPDVFRSINDFFFWTAAWLVMASLFHIAGTRPGPMLRPRCCNRRPPTDKTSASASSKLEKSSGHLLCDQDR